MGADLSVGRPRICAAASADRSDGSTTALAASCGGDMYFSSSDVSLVVNYEQPAGVFCLGAANMTELSSSNSSCAQQFASTWYGVLHCLCTVGGHGLWCMCIC